MTEINELIKLKEKLEWIISESAALKDHDIMRDIQMDLDNVNNYIEAEEEYEASDEHFYDVRDGALCDAADQSEGR